MTETTKNLIQYIKCVGLDLNQAPPSKSNSRYRDWLRAGRPRGRSSSPGSGKNFLHVQTGSGAHPASCLVGTGSSSPGLKRPGREANCSPPTSAEVKKLWIYTSDPPYAFMV
jgi:hypothetical protein